MLKRLKTRYQRWLDGTTRPVFEGEILTPGERDTFFATEPDWVSDCETTATDLPTVRLDHSTTTLVLRELSGEPDPLPRADRPYEAELGPLATELLADLDRTFQELLAEKRQQGQWRHTMFNRRTERNQTAAAVDVAHLWRDGDDEDVHDTVLPVLISAMLDRARHASDDDAPTGLIPVTVSATTMEEEPDS